MRLTVARLRRVVKADLPIEFGPQQLTAWDCCAGTSACSACIAGFARHGVLAREGGRRRWGRPVGTHSNRALSAGLSTGVAHISP